MNFGDCGARGCSFEVSGAQRRSWGVLEPANEFRVHWNGGVCFGCFAAQVCSWSISGIAECRDAFFWIWERVPVFGRFGIVKVYCGDLEVYMYFEGFWDAKVYFGCFRIQIYFGAWGMQK